MTVIDVPDNEYSSVIYYIKKHLLVVEMMAVFLLAIVLRLLWLEQPMHQPQGMNGIYQLVSHWYVGGLVGAIVMMKEANKRRVLYGLLIGMCLGELLASFVLSV